MKILMVIVTLVLVGCSESAESIAERAKAKQASEQQAASLVAELVGEKKTYVAQCMEGRSHRYTMCIDNWNRSANPPCSGGGGPGLKEAIGAGAAAGAANAVVRGLLK